MKTLVLILAFCFSVMFAKAQGVVGRWQLMKQTNCMEDQTPLNEDTGVDEVLGDMKSMSGPTSNVLSLKDNNTGEESTKIISRKKSYNSKSFLYKYNGSAIYFLDKKSHTIIEGFTVEKITTDSLIISNASRVCETKVFIRLK